MAKNFDWQDYTAKYKDADNDEQTSTVRAAVVTKDTANREVRNNLGKPVTVTEGDVIVDYGDPDRYTVHSAEEWKSAGYSKGKTLA